MNKAEIEEAKKTIIDVSKQLHDMGLLVRTWGNISFKADEDHFLITPSGIRYEDLTPDMIPMVNINDLSYEGDYKPSSESKVHAAAYKVRKDCGFIVHTHQVYASCAGTLGLKKILSYVEDEDVVIPVAAYALPGTEQLAQNVQHSIEKYHDCNSFIMANHGTLLLGRDAKEAVREAEDLEIASNNFLIDVCKTDMEHGIVEGFGSHLENGEIIYDVKDTPARVMNIHKHIYAKRPDVKYIVHNKSEAVLTVSRRANNMRPLLDDFAQLIGVSIKIPSNEHGKDGQNFHNIKKNVNVVFSLGDGAYCLGGCEDDARAVADVLDKGCIAYTAVMRHGEGHYLSLLECIKMNRHYKKTYSRLADAVNNKE
ncbi:MAG: class II aldolase/adducin family protein [Butyrivibrio sp.]|nr:class II aldolase/adducin family protein [Butyrivibrio sp.]